MSLAHCRIALCLLFALVCCLVAPARGDSGGGAQVISPTACSAYMGKVTLNELRIGSSGQSSTSNQVELYNSGGVAQAVWQTWQLVVYYRSGGGTISLKGGYYLSSGFSANGQFIYNSSKAMYMRNKSGRYMSVALVDSAGKLIDWVALDGAIQTLPSCFGSGMIVNATASSDTSGDVARVPDGTTWPSAVNNTAGNTISRTNVCTSGSDLVVGNSASNTSPIVNTTPVSFTVTVLNKSCSNTVSSIAITDMGITTANFSGLSFAPGSGSVVQSTNSLGWTVGTLAAGSSATLVVTGTPLKLGAINTTASVSGSSGGLINTGDDSSAANLTVRDFNYVDFDVTTDTITEGLVTSYSAAISATVVPSAPITINYTVSGTAGSGDTDLPVSGSVVIDPSNAESPSQTSIDFVVKNDSVVEPLKTIVLTITSVSSSDASVRLDVNSQMTITLRDDDAVLAAQYHLEENTWTGAAGEVKDSSGNAFNGKAVGVGGLPTTDATTPAVVSSPGTCAYGVFTGAASNPQQLAFGALNLGLDSAPGFTVSAWVQWSINPATGNPWANIVSNVASSSVDTGQFWLQHSQLNNRFEFALKSTSTRSFVQSKTTPVAGQWYYLTGVFDGVALHIYVNGILDDNSVVNLAGTVTPFVSTYQLAIGSTSSSFRGFQGFIDEVAIYKGALAPSQIANLFDTTHPCPTRQSPAPAALNAVDTGGNAVSGRISTKISGAGFNLDVYALNAARSAQDVSYSGSVLVDLLANTATGVAQDSQNCPVSYTSALTVGTAALTAGKGVIAVPAVADAWRDVRVRLRYPATGSASVTACSSDNFAVKPNSLGVAASGSAGSLAGSAIQKAGQVFTLVFTGYNSAGSITGNYNGSPVAPTANISPVSPATLAGTLATGSFSGSGTISSSTATYSEVGNFNVTFQDTGFAAVDAGDTAASCAGFYVCTASTLLGRFVPDHYAVSGGAAIPACGVFSYFGQDGLRTSFTLTAQNAAGGTTQNYTGSLATLGLGSYSPFAFTATGLSPVPSLASGAIGPSGSWSAGTAQVSAWHVVSRPSSLSAKSSLGFYVAPVDSDGVTVGPSNPALVVAGVDFRYGRLQIFNAFGTDQANLSVPLQARYWSGSSWVLNSDDNCTAVPAAAVALSGQTGTLASSNMSTAGNVNRPAGSSTTLINGSGNIVLKCPYGSCPTAAKPAQAYTGTVDMALNLGSGTADASCLANHPTTTGANLAWLRYSTGACGGQDPSARASFGIYAPETRKTVHVREVY